jgi:hypothetical protein
MIRQLRGFGVKMPIVTTSSWGNAPLSSLPALLAGDIVDAHAYGGIDELKKSPLTQKITFGEMRGSAECLKTGPQYT